MKFWEAMKALEEGKKVRRNDWPFGEYITLENSSFFNENRKYYSLTRSDGWELYEEPKKPVTRWKWAFYVSSMWVETDSFYTDEEALKKDFDEHIKLEYTATEFPE